jgi:hypothetical protein
MNNILEQLKDEKKSLLRSTSAGSNFHPDQKYLSQLLDLLIWFCEKMPDQYLDGNEKTILRAIQRDSPVPKEIKELLIQQEKSKLHREEIIEALSEK